MANICIGRLQLDLPPHFATGPSSEIEFFFGRGADHQKVTATLVEGDVKVAAERRASELSSQHHFTSSTKNRLHSLRALASSAIAVWGYEGARSTDAMRIEVFRQVGGQTVRLAEQAYQDRKAEVVEARLLDLVSRASQTAGGAAPPSGRGVCLGPVVLDIASDVEIVNAEFQSSAWPTIRIEAQTNSLVQEPDGGLLKRWDRGGRDFRAAGFEVKVLQRGSVMPGGFQAEELLTVGTEDARRRWDFDFESLSYAPNITKPAVRLAVRASASVSPDAGGTADQPTTEAELIKFWKAFTQSIRTRPGAG